MSHYPVCYATLQLLHVLYAPGYVFSNVVTPAAQHRYTSNPTSRNSLSVGSEQRAHATSAYVSPPRPAFKGPTWNRKQPIVPPVTVTSNYNMQIVHLVPKNGVTQDLSTRELPTISPFLPHPVIVGPI